MHADGHDHVVWALGVDDVSAGFVADVLADDRVCLMTDLAAKEAVEGNPIADVVPVAVDGDHEGSVGAFHEGVVDARLGEGGEGLGDRPVLHRAA